jgi:hypothetical protein
MVLSAVWLCLVFLLADEYRRMPQVLGLGLLPLVILWGVIWAVAGWRAQRSPSPPLPTEAQKEATDKRRLRFRVAIAVVVILVIGLFAANWQFHAADREGSKNVAHWLGEWIVWGLLAYVVLRITPKVPPGTAGVLTALLIVGGVNFNAFRTLALEREMLASLAMATPIINRIKAGTPVTDQEVRDAKVGVLEPLLLAQATYAREILMNRPGYRGGSFD